MVGQSFGGLIWTSQEPPQETSLLKQGIQLGAMAGAGYGLFRAGMRDWGGVRGVDHAAAAARVVGNLSPLQILNTFRVPEFLSPFTSNKHLNIKADSISWGREALTSPSTYHYLKKATGLSDRAMAQAGLGAHLTGGAEAASELLFRRGAGEATGSLFTVVGGEERLLASDMTVMSMAGDIDPILKQRQAVNRAAQGVMGALDAWSMEGFSPDDVLSATVRTTNEAGKAINKVVTSQHLPIPSPGGPALNWSELMRKTSYMRGIAAFEMARFNNLLGGFAEQYMGTTGRKLAELAMGGPVEALPGPASTMFARYGLRAGRMGALIGGVATIDWARREFGMPGQVAAGAVTSAGLAAVAQRLGARPQTAGLLGAASFIGQMVLPGFDQGILQGVATTGVKALELRGSALNPVNYYRRTLEGFFPGASAWETGALFSLGAMGAMAFKVPGVGKRLPELLLQHKAGQRLGFPLDLRGVPTTRDVFWNVMARSTEQADVLDPSTFRGRRAIRRQLVAEHGSSYEANRFMNEEWAKAEEAVRRLQNKNPLTKQLITDLDKIALKYSSPGLLNQIRKETEGFMRQTVMSFFGADAAHNKETRDAIRKLGFRGPVGRLGRYGTVGLAAFGLHQLLTGAALGSMQTTEELTDIYERGKPVAVRRGRMWEFGGTPLAGGDVQYHRPSLYFMWMNRVRERGIWGHDEPNPISKFLIKNFTYDLERQHYYDRPYPITSAAFEDVPVIGGVLSATIGRLIKPPRVMHSNEWIRPDRNGSLEFASVYDGARREPSYQHGAVGPGVPESSYGAMIRLAQLSSQARQLSGLTGFVRNTVQKIITGEDGWSVNGALLASAGDIDSPSKKFWELDAGGFFGMTEAIRRIFPKDGGIEGERLNPLRNQMPSWLPQKYSYGDPYRRVPWGEARLPGAGFEALHPELQGVDPEAYPMIYRYMILGDVAPTSTEFRRLQGQMYQRRSQGITTGWEDAMMDRADKQIQEKMAGLDWEQHTPGSIRLPGSGLTADFTLGAQQLLRTVSAPIEFMSPGGFRPIHKLLSNRDPIEEYESRRFTTQLAFWDKPWRDWLRPTGVSLKQMLGFDGKPGWRREADNTNAYFDQLEFLKWMRLAEQAQAAGDGHAQRQYEWAASQTRFGVNPQGNPMGIYWTLPAEERPFFNAFAHAQGTERERVLEMVPEDMTHLYRAIWGRMDRGDPSLYMGETGGLDQAYMRQQYYGLANMLSTPEDDWIGWHCLPVGQAVLNSLATRIDVDKIVPGYPVWQTDVQNIVLETHVRYTEEEMVELWVDRDRVDSMSATSNHKVFAWKCPWKKDHLRRRITSTRWDKDGKFAPKWIRIGELKEGDYLVVPVPGIESLEPLSLDMAYICRDVPRIKFDNAQVWTYYKTPEHAAVVKRWVALSTDLAWLVGYYLAEGHVGRRNGVTRYAEWTSHATKEGDLRQKVLRILRDEFGVEGTESIRKKKSGNSGTVRAQGQVAYLLGDYFAPGVAHTKRLEHADQLLRSQEHVEAFLGGLFAGDGTKRPQGSDLCTTSEVLHRQVKEMLLACGVVPTVRKVIRYNRRPSWHVRFVRSTDAAKRIHDQVIRDLMPARDISPCKPKAFVKNGHLYSRIGTVKKTIYKGMVYDLTVENVHAYRSPIGLYHNSDIDMDDIRVRYVDQFAGDLADYGLWESGLNKAMAQPFLDGTAAEIAPHVNASTSMDVRSTLYRLAGSPMSRGSVSVANSLGRSSAEFDFNDRRDLEIRDQVMRNIYGY